MNPSRTKSPLWARALLAAAFGFGALPLGYAWVRALETWMFPRENPLAVVAMTESGFFTRCVVAALVGGMAVFGGWALSARPALAARTLVAIVLFGAVSLATVAGFWP